MFIMQYSGKEFLERKDHQYMSYMIFIFGPDKIKKKRTTEEKKTSKVNKYESLRPYSPRGDLRIQMKQIRKYRRKSYFFKILAMLGKKNYTQIKDLQFHGTIRIYTRAAINK